MIMTAQQPQAILQIPPIDLTIPSMLETATFALG